MTPAEELAILLASLVVRKRGVRPETIKTWAVEFRYMLNKYQPSYVRAVMEWALADQFWKTVITDVRRFKDNFEMLCRKHQEHIQKIDQQKVFEDLYTRLKLTQDSGDAINGMD